MPERPTQRALPVHGGQMSALAAELGISPDQLLDFSASIHPVPPPGPVLEKLSRYVSDARNLICYPETSYSALKNAIAAYAGVEADSILVGNGLMPLLQATLNALQSDKCLVLAPAFVEYRRVLEACGTEYVPMVLTNEQRFALDTDTVLRALRDTGCKTLLFANPHSPSGYTMPGPVLHALVASAAQLGVTTIVDEAFIDYVPEESLAPTLASSLVLLRSLTKFFAMPGLRVGYAVARPGLRERIEACMPLWPVDTIAAEAATLMLAESNFIESARGENAMERTWLAEQLQALGVEVYPSRANYLLLQTRQEWGAEFWNRLVVDHHIVLRACANFEGLDESFFRIGVRTRAENEKLLAACARVLASLGASSSATAADLRR